MSPQHSIRRFYISGTPENCTIRLYRSYDEGDIDYCDVMGFSTVNDDDETEDEFISGKLEDCLDWLEKGEATQKKSSIQA